MQKVIYINENKTFRVIENNFWFTVQHRGGGMWRKQFSTRDKEVAISIARSYA